MVAWLSEVSDSEVTLYNFLYSQGSQPAAGLSGDFTTATVVAVLQLPPSRTKSPSIIVELLKMKPLISRTSWIHAASPIRGI